MGFQGLWWTNFKRKGGRRGGDFTFSSGLKNTGFSITIEAVSYDCMSPKLKLAAYAVLLILAAWFAWGFYSNYSAVSNAAKAASAQDTDSAPAPAPETNPPVATPDADTNSVATTNAGTNLSAQSTNAAAGTNNAVAIAATATNLPAQPTAGKPAPVANASAERGAMIGYLAAFVGTVIGLGLLIATDVTQLVGQQAVDFLFNDDGEGIRDPEYERAEQVWANGQHLEAVQMLRDFLKKNPRQLHAALRIAEIYEKDLHNYLAAALEYEEILKHKLPAERWGWAAIHLCNLYSRIGQPEKSLVLLRRVADDYPQTAAAKKARTRLGLQEPEAETVAEEAPAEDGANPPEAAEPEAKPEPPSNLPPGFRPKK
jgi:TolA-binding protein